MRRFAQIESNKAYWIFEAEEMPEFAPNIILKDITNIFPQPQEGWGYDSATNIFFIPPVIQPSIDEIKHQKITQITDIYNQKLSEGFTSSATGNAHIFGYGTSDQMKFIRLAIGVMSGIKSFPVDIPAKDNTIVWHIQEQYQLLMQDIGRFDTDMNTLQHQFIDQVNACLTIEEVNAIVVQF